MKKVLALALLAVATVGSTAFGWHGSRCCDTCTTRACCDGGCPRCC